MFLSVIFSIWLIIAGFFCFKNLKYGTAFFLAYWILVPVVQLNLGSFHIGENAFNLIFLFSYILYAKKNRIDTDWKPFIPFVVYFLMCLIAMPFQEFVPINYMINVWRIGVIKTLILPFVMWNVVRNDKSALTIYIRTMLICIFISVAYGLFLTTTAGANPYQFLCLDIFGATGMLDADYYEFYYAAEDTGRIFGRISSVFLHPMNFALFLGLSFIFLFYNRENIKQVILFLLIIGIILMSIFCGVRSVIGALGVTIVYYFMAKRNYKLMTIVIIALFIGDIIIQQIPELNAYLSSITDVGNNNQAVIGSSWDLRFGQLNGAMEEASKSPFWGLGYGWTGHYLSTKGAHPVCLCFESLVYMVICNNGIWGIITWILFIVAIYSYNKKRVVENSVVNALLVFYVIYACITGDSGYMQYFLLFYILMLAASLYTPSISNKNPMQ